MKMMPLLRRNNYVFIIIYIDLIFLLILYFPQSRYWLKKQGVIVRMT